MPPIPADRLRAALTGRIAIPEHGFISAAPNFEPHDGLKDSVGRQGSYFTHWNRLFNQNPLFAALIYVATDMVLFQGFRLVSDNPAHLKRWEIWVERNDFLQQLRPLVLEAFKQGNGMALMTNESPSDPLALELQPLPARGFWPELNADRTRVENWLFTWPLSQQDFDPQPGGGPTWRLPMADVFWLRFNAEAGSFFGRAIGYQAINLLVQTNEMLMLLATMSRRNTHGILWIQVDTHDLDATIPTGDDAPAAGQETKTEEEKLVDAYRDVFDGRVQLDKRTFASTIDHNLYTDERAKLTMLEPKNDTDGMIKALDTAIRILDRILGVPKLFYGESEDSNRATAKEQRRIQAMKSTIPWNITAEEMRSKLLPEIGIPPSEAHFEPVHDLVVEDEETRAKLMLAIGQLARDLHITNSEARAELQRHFTTDLEELAPELDIDPADTVAPPA